MPSLLSNLEVPSELAAVLENPELATYPPEKLLLVGDENLSEHLEDWKIEVGENGGMVFTGTLSGRLNQDLANAPVTLKTYIDDHEILAFSGLASRPLMKRTSTEITAYTPLAIADDVVLPNGLLPFPVTTATVYARAALYLMGMYPEGQTRIDEFDMWLNRVDENGFAPGDTVGAVLNAVRDETEAIFRDVPPNGIEGFLPQTALSNPLWSYSSDDALEDSWAVEGFVDQLYAYVYVNRKSEPDADPPIAGYRVRVPVRYEDMPYKPNVKLIDWIEVTEDDGILGPAQAYRFARRRAEMYSLQRHEFQGSWPYNPFLKFGGAIKILEDAQDLSGQKYHYEWLALLDKGVTHQSVRQTDVTGTLQLLSATKIEAPPATIDLPSVSVVQTAPTIFVSWGQSDLYLFELTGPYADLPGAPFVTWGDDFWKLDYLTDPYSSS